MVFQKSQDILLERLQKLASDMSESKADSLFAPRNTDTYSETSFQLNKHAKYVESASCSLTNAQTHFVSDCLQQQLVITIIIIIFSLLGNMPVVDVLDGDFNLSVYPPHAISIPDILSVKSY